MIFFVVIVFRFLGYRIVILFNRDFKGFDFLVRNDFRLFFCNRISLCYCGRNESLIL